MDAVEPNADNRGSGGRSASARFRMIGDNFRNLSQVQNALRDAGLESSNLIVGVDFTKSNEWTGKYAFGGKNLHEIGELMNPYESAITIIGRTLDPFDEDNEIPCFGFGDTTTHDRHCFAFFADHRPCKGFTEVLSRYRTIRPLIKLSGPTSFAPVIKAACRIVEKKGGQYHVLVIIADGQVTAGEDGQLSVQEEDTMEAIREASNYPLSIVMVGVGDGPWDTMKGYDDRLPQRNFDNFQFVNYTSILLEGLEDDAMEAQFALQALMEIPLQYRACVELGILGRPYGHLPDPPLPPPPAVIEADHEMAGAIPPRGR